MTLTADRVKAQLAAVRAKAAAAAEIAAEIAAAESTVCHSKPAAKKSRRF